MTIYELDGFAPELGEGAWVAPNAVVLGKVELGARSSVWFGSTIRADNDHIVIGEEPNIQDGCVLHTDEGIRLIVGNRVTVGHKAMLHGCTIGDSSLIGIGAIVLNHARVGTRTIIGAGSLVPQGKVVPDGVLALGTPIEVIRPLTAKELEHLEFAARHYVERAARFASKLAPR